MNLNTLDDLLLHELKDIYDAERRLTKALPKMAKAASSDKLRRAFEKHLSVTEKQVARLERIFKLLDQPARGKKCMGMMGLIEEGSELMGEEGSAAALDAGLIGAAQKVEHYEIAAYGTMVTYAGLLGHKEVERLLKQTLGEEKETDEELTKLASTINFEAEQEDDSAEAEKPVRGRTGRTRAARGKHSSNGNGNGKFLKRMGQALSGWVG